VYKAEKQLLSLSHDEWNRLGENFGLPGQAAQHCLTTRWSGQPKKSYGCLSNGNGQCRPLCKEE